MTIKAKYNGVCAATGKSYGPGTPIEKLPGSSGWRIVPGATPTPTVAEKETPEEMTRVCWECGCPFTRAQARRKGGDWEEGYCGC